MTQKDREDRFIESFKKRTPNLTWESELLLRYGYAAGADEMGQVSYAEGVEVQRDRVLDVLGATARKERALP